MTFRTISPKDRGAYSEIVERSDAILDRTLSRERPGFVRRLLTPGDWYGTKGECLTTSDAVTRAAHSLGITASREVLAGWHFITSFAPLDQMPGPGDLVMCRTWGQYDKRLYAGGHPRSAQPFFGQRQELAHLLPEATATFQPDGVSYRQVIHAQSYSPETRHVWLCTTPEEVASGAYSIAEVATTEAYPAFWA
jgi:hypothetical protein